jgi:hypothetical protein
MTMDRSELRRYARLGALDELRRILKAFPDLLDEVRPKRRMPTEAREALAEAASNGKPGRRKWTVAQHQRFRRTMKRKARERAASRS